MKKYTTKPVKIIKNKNFKTKKRKSTWISSLKNINPKQKKKIETPKATRGK